MHLPLPKVRKKNLASSVKADLVLHCPLRIQPRRLISLFIAQDTGISVRKRVIKILRDICLNQPDFPKTTEICVKIIRRITDEEGIKASCYY